jgi:hypothetical protein
VQGNGPRASRLRASGVRAVQEQCAGDATGRVDPAGGYAGVPTVFLQHTRVSSGDLACEQENPEVREGVGIANQSGPIGFFHKTTTSSNSYSLPIGRARPQHIKKAREPSYRASSSPTEPRHRQALLITDPVRHGNSLSIHSLLQQGYPKVCPDPLNLPNTGDPLCRNIVVFNLFSVFPDQGLNCFDLESSRVFFVKFPELSLFSNQ